MRSTVVQAQDVIMDETASALRERSDWSEWTASKHSLSHILSYMLDYNKNIRLLSKSTGSGMTELLKLPLFEISNRPAVASFISEYPSIGPFLNRFHDRVQEFFQGEIEKLRVRLVVDPETSQRRLVIFIVTSLDIEKAMTCLKKFEFEWFLPNYDDSLGLLVVDVTWENV